MGTDAGLRRTLPWLAVLTVVISRALFARSEERPILAGDPRCRSRS